MSGRHPGARAHAPHGGAARGRGRRGDRVRPRIADDGPDAWTARSRSGAPRSGSGCGPCSSAGIAIAFALGVVTLLPDTPLLTAARHPGRADRPARRDPARRTSRAQVIAARDARRYVVGLISAVVGWFVVFYPNIAALPLPSTIVNAYQGLLPTYLYAFQFPISQVARSVATPLLSPTLAHPDAGHRRDLPGRGLLGLGVAARARGIATPRPGHGRRATTRTAWPAPTGA